MLKRFSLILLLSLFFLSPLYAQTSKAKTEDIKRLMEMTGAKNIATQFASAITQQMFMMLRAGNPEIPDRAFEVMANELMAFFSEKMSAPGGLLDLTIPVYDKHFTHKEIKELLAFYESPIGKKVIQTLPQVTSESMAIGQRWGESLGPEIETRIFNALTKEGLLPEIK